MINFTYTRASSSKSVCDQLKKETTSRIIAGGTNLVDLMKRGVAMPGKLIDVSGVPLRSIEASNKGLHIGSLATNTEVAEHPAVKSHALLLSLALQAGASPQLRNMATVGGNIMQRTRCSYFYDTAMPCNKREPGTGCSAIGGYNRMHAIFGASEQCIAVHPSDMCVGLAALEATVHIQDSTKERTVAFTEFHRLPGDTPHIDTQLKPHEMITGLTIPADRFGPHVHYLKIRDRSSYAFALVSVAAALEIKSGVIASARLAMGGVAHKPWRLFETENFLAGKPASKDIFQQASTIGLAAAKAYTHNQFKRQLAPAAVAEALTIAANKS